MIPHKWIRDKSQSGLIECLQCAHQTVDNECCSLIATNLRLFLTQLREICRGCQLQTSEWLTEQRRGDMAVALPVLSSW